jgi:hypothetical protein
MGLLADVSELAIRTEAWADFCERAWAAGHTGYATELEEMGPETRESVRTHLAQAVKELRRLRQRAGEALRGLKDLAGPLERPEGRPAGDPRQRGTQ